MRCERCGKEISDSAAICPSCGTLTMPVQPARPAQPGPVGQPPTQHGTYPTGDYDEPLSSYEQGYAPRQNYMPPQPPPQPNYMPPPQSNYHYGPSYRPPFQQPGSININVYNNYAPPVSPAQKKTNALLVEIICSLFGIFGIGWLVGDETTTGVILLICSVTIYMPFIILGTLFTLGIGLVCIGPLSIGCIIANAILLSNRLKRKAAQQITIIQGQQMPPQYPRY